MVVAFAWAVCTPLWVGTLRGAYLADAPRDHHFVADDRKLPVAL